MADYYIGITEAAYLMGMSEETVKKMIDNGELLCRKNANPIMIHESEMGRFMHPWRHIARLDQRITAQQMLVEKLKLGRSENEDWTLAHQVNDLQYNIEHLEPLIKGMQLKIEEIMTKLPALMETVHSLQQSKQKPIFRKKKK
jgi:uncharacterized coiled-coil protein SlyX